MKKLSQVKVLTLSFVLFTIHILLPDSSFVPRVHSQTFHPTLEGTNWEGVAEISLNTVDVITINADFIFTANRKVSIAYRTQLAGLRTKWRYNPFTEREDPSLEYTIISVIPGAEATSYKQDGRTIHIEFYDYYIDATLNGNIMEGIIGLKSRPNKGKWVAKRVSGASNNTASNEQSENGEIQKVWIEHNVYDEQTKGMRIHLTFTAWNLKDKQCTANAYFYSASGKPLKDFNDTFRTPAGNVATHGDFTPKYERTVFNDFQIFMPYDELHLDKGEYGLKFVVQLHCKGIGFFARSKDYAFTYARSK